jgi:methyl-accepting chemotaxis protein
VVAEAALLATSDEDIQLFEKMRSYLEDFESYQSDLLEMARDWGADVAMTIYESEYAPMRLWSADALSKFAQRRREAMVSGFQDAIDRSLVSQKMSLAAMGAGLVASLMLGWRISGRIARPIRRIMEAADTVAGGDLTAEVPATGTGDEVERLTESVREMMMGLRRLIQGVLEMTEEVAGASAELSASAEESSLAVDQIAGTVQELAAAGQRQGADAVSVTGSARRLEATIAEVAQGAERQAASARESARSVDQAGAALSESRTVLEAVMDSVTHNSELARRGSESVDAVSARMDEIVSATQDVERRIRELEGHSHEIGRILEVIRDIADQTNLLALNAAIEAARAGEHGRGFAVVADEVRKLAERSSAETKAIGALVQSIVESTGSAVRAMAGGARAVGAGKEVSSQASAALEEIAYSSSQLGKLVEKLIAALVTVEGATSAVKQHMSGIMGVAEANTAAARSMRADAGQVQEDVSGVASLAEENAASIQEVSASAEQVAASLKGMADSTGILTDMAQKLRLEVGRFKVS